MLYEKNRVRKSHATVPLKRLKYDLEKKVLYSLVICILLHCMREGHILFPFLRKYYESLLKEKEHDTARNVVEILYAYNAHILAEEL